MRGSTTGQYEPIPGSYPAKAIAHLRSLPPGTWVPSAVLAEAIGLDDGKVQPYLMTAVKGGALIKRRCKDNVQLGEWSLGDGVPDPGPPPDEPLEPTEKPQRPVPTSAFDVERIVARAKASSTSEPEVERRFKRAGTSTVPEFRAGLFTDGTLVIEAQGQRMVLVADHVAQLRQLVAWSKP